MHNSDLALFILNNSLNINDESKTFTILHYNIRSLRADFD